MTIRYHKTIAKVNLQNLCRCWLMCYQVAKSWCRGEFPCIGKKFACHVSGKMKQN